MCYHKQDKAAMAELSERYRAVMHDIGYQPTWYENGFDFKPSPLLTAEQPGEFQMMNWGFIPWWIKSVPEAIQVRLKTLNCISEEMWDKPAFRDSAREGRRCLIPCTGFYEWRWFNGGKVKYPYFVSVRNEPIFSLAGLWSSWTDKTTEEIRYTYTVLTTRANTLMEKIHNSKKRMPVIIPREYERDWLNPSLKPEDVNAFCEPAANDTLEAWTISKMITDRKVEDKDRPEICQKFEYPELALLDS
ncbi:MAG: SOS response-associated peptidase [Bacteroidetes bacterium]|nr:SOS response-associated peptidase [Bacteroidota bacterium]